MKDFNKPKIIAVVGQTASGKSALAIKLAKKFDGEIISADSRQVYKGLDIGTGKVTKKEMASIPHHLLDVALPKNRFTVSKYKEMADKAIAEIISRGKLPIICGGTGFYIDAVVKNITLPDVPVNKKLRDTLQKKTTEKLFKMLCKLDKKRANEIGPQNKIRLIRAIEIAKKLGKIPSLASQPIYETLTIGIDINKELLKKRIVARNLVHVKRGMINEAKKLHAKGLSWKRMEELGLEYRSLARHLQGLITKQQMVAELDRDIYQYARRQAQWFRRDKNIKWFKATELSKINSAVTKFLKS